MQHKSVSPFEYHVPNTVNGVIELLGAYGKDAMILAGGTDVIPKLKGGVATPGHLISLKKLKELSFIRYDEKVGLTFGATATLKALEDHPIVKGKYRALFEGVHSMASTQIKNTATVVGNICNAVPSADTAPPLLCLGAVLKAASLKGTRLIPIEDFFIGVCKTVLSDDELITEVQIPVPSKNQNSTYFKYTVRRALDLAMVGVAAALEVKGQVCEGIKIALGAVAVMPVRARQTEKMLEGKLLTDELIDNASRFASENECSPISDIRASKEYRKEIVRLLTRDVIKALSSPQVA